MTEDWLLSLATAPGVRATPGVRRRGGRDRDGRGRARCHLPAELRVWLRVWLRACDGTWIGGGEIFGLAPATFADVVAYDLAYDLGSGGGQQPEEYAESFAGFVARRLAEIR